MLTDGGDGWIDSEGRFGYALHPGWEPIGEPHGHPEPVSYYNGICLQCDRIYTLIHPMDGVDIPLEHKPVSSDGTNFQTVYLLPSLVSEYKIHNEYTNYGFTHIKTPCPECDGPLLSGSELVLRVAGRESDRRLSLPPLHESSVCETCPKCRQTTLSFHEFWVS
ncbi:MAG: hypothetical protein RTU30_15735 [Candidatus Thorarchaeota archaeon]